MDNSSLTQLEIQNLINLYNSELRKLHFQYSKTQNTIKELQDSLEGVEIGQQVPGDISTVEEPETPVKRGPGRPPKKRGPGRPPKAKRGPGRPPKAKRGPGRPPKAKRGPGRPPKKRGPGRPPKKRGPGRPPKAKSASTGTKSSSTGRKKRVVKGGGYKLSDWDKFLIHTIQQSSSPMINKEILAVAKEKYKNESESNLSGKISRSIHKLANKRKVLKKHKYEGRGYAYTVNPNAKWH